MANFSFSYEVGLHILRDYSGWRDSSLQFGLSEQVVRHIKSSDQAASGDTGRLMRYPVTRKN